MTNLIGISGKIGSGKDTVGNIITHLVSPGYCDENGELYDDFHMFPNRHSPWEIKKFAGKVKDIVCILTGCNLVQLEDSDFKNSKLSDEWIRYGYADGFKHIHEDGVKTTVMINKQCSKEVYEYEKGVNWQTAYKSHITYRELMQYIGTDLFRNKFHEDTWINATMNDYRPLGISKEHWNKTKSLYKNDMGYPNWIITDVRFPNEFKAIKDRGGLVIRVNRNSWFKDEQEKFLKERGSITSHQSETALDNYAFDYTINNDSSIEELISIIKQLLIKEGLI